MMDVLLPNSWDMFNPWSWNFSLMSNKETSQVALVVENLPASAGDIKRQVQFLGQEDALEEGMATQVSTTASGVDLILIWGRCITFLLLP